MKKTAVEWLKDQIECFGNKHELQMSWATLDELFEQAKQMEREQIEDAIEYGFNYGCRYANREEGECSSQPYYEQTYGGQDE
jgi:hypothetical protein